MAGGEMTNKAYSNLGGWDAPQGNASLPSEPPVGSNELVVPLVQSIAWKFERAIEAETPKTIWLAPHI